MINWQSLYSVLGEALGPIVTSAIVTLIAFIIKYVIEKTKATNNAAIITLAGTAVRYVETHFGPDTGTGIQKEQQAVDFLCSKFKWLPRDEAMKFIKAAYQAIFTNIAPLEPGAATSLGAPLAPSTSSQAGV